MTERIDLGAELAGYTGAEPGPKATPLGDIVSSIDDVFTRFAAMIPAGPPLVDDRCRQCRRSLPAGYPGAYCEDCRESINRTR